MRAPDRRRRFHGFSILELLVVISVIAILAAVTISVAIVLKRHMAIKAARADAARFAQAIEAYAAPRSYVPVHKLFDPMTAPDGAYENAEILGQLDEKDKTPIFRPQNSELNANGSFKDPWGVPFRYIPSKQKPDDPVYKSFEIYSCGPNMCWEMGGGDDIPAP